MYTLLLIIVFATTAGPQELSWTIPDLSGVQCEQMAKDALLSSATLPEGFQYQAHGICIAGDAVNDKPVKELRRNT